MTVLLVGCGYWGKNWAKALYNMGELGAICEASPRLQAQLKEQYPDIPLYADLETALAHQGIEAAVVATPVVTHLNIARQCLQAGKHTLVEKPLTLDPDEAEQLIRLSEASGLVLAVGHLLMYQPALLKLQELIQQGELGELLSVHCTRINLGKVRNEENVWWSLAPHDLSILSMLLGEPFSPVAAAKMLTLQRSDIEDSVYASFETPSGKTASIHTSWLLPTKRHETVVVGTKKIAIFEDTQPVERKLQLLEYDLPRNGDEFGDIRRGESTFVHYDIPADDLLTTEAKAFLQAARGGKPLQNDGANGLQVVRMLDEVQSMLDRQKQVSRRAAQPVS